MRFLAFDAVGGASGDMILNALVELCERAGTADLGTVRDTLHALIPDHFHLRREEKASHGLAGKVLVVDVHEHEHEHHHEHEHEHEHHHEHERHHHHAHRSFADIRGLIESGGLPAPVKSLSLAVFGELAAAEGAVHGVPADEVHFHEVGAVDSIVDIVGACLAFACLDVAGITLSPLPTGRGTVRCAHGVYPVPAPATAALLERFGLEVATDDELGEMLTPTAAALLGVFPKVELPPTARLVTTYNAFGHRDMRTRPNVLRVSLYESAGAPTAFGTETLTQLECNVDDATGEQLADAMRVLFEAGALDVWFSPLTMKKQRPGVLLGALVGARERDAVLDAMFRHSGTFGIRETRVLRHSLARRWTEVDTPYGTVRVKIGTLNGEDIHFAPEFADCQRLAEAAGVPFLTVFRSALD